MNFVIWMIWMGCNRDLVIGVENLPMGESFVLTMDGQTLTNRDFNLWSVSSVSMRQPHQLQLWYGERQCILTNAEIVGEMGFGELTHSSNWSCPGLLGYTMHPVGDLLVGESEVTVGLWQQIKGEDQEDVCGAECPKSNINWLQALEFANQMSMLEGLGQCYRKVEDKKSQTVVEIEADCTGYRLPTDAEWVKFSSLDPDSPYADSDTSSSVGWVRDNSDVERHPVCELPRNGYQLCDITGNVWEWCWDTFERPQLRRVRGGGFTSVPAVALRENGVDFPANLGAEHIGFRLVRAGR